FFFCALQGIDDDCLRSVIGRFVGAPGNANGAIGGVIVWPVALVQLTVQRRLLYIPERLVDKRQIVMSGHIFRIQRQSILKLFQRQAQKLPVTLGGSMFLSGALDVGLSQFVDHFVILGKIEATPVQFGITIFQDAAVGLDRL